MPDSSWDIVRLNRRHVRGQFDCGDEELNRFFGRHARQNDDKGLGRTFVATRQGERRGRGYYTMASGSVAFANLPDKERKGLGRYPVPVALLARLAVDRSEQGRGLGETLLMHALSTVLVAAQSIGIRAVEVVAKNESAKRFYLKYGFAPLLDDQLHLYLATEAVRKAFGVRSPSGKA